MTPTESPSFAPWASRVQQIRTWSSVAGFALAGGVALQTGKTWEQASFVALGAAVVFMFVSWASALWICAEMHAAEIGKLRAAVVERERLRQEELQALYRARMHGTSAGDRVDDLMLLAVDDDTPQKAA